MSRGLKERERHYQKHPANKPRLSLHQVLSGNEQHRTQFFAVIVDPDTQKRIKEVLIWESEPGEILELALERFTIIEHSDGE